MRIPDHELAASVAELVRIPSVNPLQAGARAGTPGERAIADHLADRLVAAGAGEVVVDPVLDDRPNVYGLFPGRSRRLVVLDVHLDTVSVEHMTDDPFDGRIEHGRVWGRGALDTKASLGVITALLAGWHRAGLRPRPTLLVVGSVSEESGGLLGATRFREWIDERGIVIDQLIVAEPTRLAPVHGHKGGAALRITALGAAAHSALPHLGRNAIDAIAPVLTALAAEHARLIGGPATTALGTGTLTVATIEGGTGPNVVPDRCSIVVGRRIAPGEDAEVEFDRIAQLAIDACPLPVEIESVLPVRPDGRRGSDAFHQPPGTALVQDLARWAGTTPSVAPFGTNALRYADLDAQIAVFGPGSIDDAHQATESIAINDLARTAEVLTHWLAPS